MHYRDVPPCRGPAHSTKGRGSRDRGVALLVIALADSGVTQRSHIACVSEVLSRKSRERKAAGYYERLLDGEPASREDESAEDKAFRRRFPRIHSVCRFGDRGASPWISAAESSPGSSRSLRWNETVFPDGSRLEGLWRLGRQHPEASQNVSCRRSGILEHHGAWCSPTTTSTSRYVEERPTGRLVGPADIEFEGGQAWRPQATRRLNGSTSDFRTTSPGSSRDWILSDLTVLDYSLEELHLKWVVPTTTWTFRLNSLSRGCRAIGSFSRLDSPQAVSRQACVVFGDDHGRLAMRNGRQPLRRIGVPLSLVLSPARGYQAQGIPTSFCQLKDMASRSTDSRVWTSPRDLSRISRSDEYRIAPWEPHPNALGHKLISERPTRSPCSTARRVHEPVDEDRAVSSVLRAILGLSRSDVTWMPGDVADVANHVEDHANVDQPGGDDPHVSRSPRTTALNDPGVRDIECARSCAKATGIQIDAGAGGIYGPREVRWQTIDDRGRAWAVRSRTRVVPVVATFGDWSEITPVAGREGSCGMESRI